MRAQTDALSMDNRKCLTYRDSMVRLIRIAGVVMALVGLFVMVAPFISVERVGTQMLAELPAVNGAGIVDERVGWSAMFDDDFVVARRTYSGVSEQVVVDALRQDGFDTVRIDGFGRACCGDYDAVWVAISTSDSGSVVAIAAACRL